MATEPLNGIDNRRKWVIGLFGCMSYRDSLTHESECYPAFCPIAMLCTGITTGRIITKLYDEKPCCFDMGCRGFCCCCMTIPLHIGSPLGGLSMFTILSYYLRSRVIAKYNVVETETCCCGPLNPCCEALHINCNYPCSMFQMSVSIKEWEREVRVMIDPPTSPLSPSSPMTRSVVINPPTGPPATPVAAPRDAVPAAMVGLPDMPALGTPVRATVVTSCNGVQVAIPVATPIGHATYA